MEQNVKNEIKDFLLHKIDKCRVLVLGDVMLDRYFYGAVTRISPEAPVPVNSVVEQKDTLGGAANVAHNLSKLGCQVYLAGIVGDDHHGHILRRNMKRIGINTNGLILGRKKTTTKIRILGGHQQMLRLDFEETEPICDEIGHQLERYINKLINDGIDAIILSDYHKGVCIERICQVAISTAHRRNIPVLVDPKGKNWECYRGADYITPNIRETSEVIGYSVKNEEVSLREAAEEVKQGYQIENVIVTRSEQGMSLFLKEKEIHIPTVAQEVFDVSGAGDTVIAAFTAGISGGLDQYTAAQMANFAAGIGVGKVGTHAVSKEEVLVSI